METTHQIFFIFSVIGFFIAFLSFLLYKFPPENINSFYGYRSSRSLSSQKKWDFAQKYSNKIMLRIGLILALSWIPFYFLNIAPHFFVICFIVEMLILFAYMFFKTEKALKDL